MDHRINATNPIAVVAQADETWGPTQSHTQHPQQPLPHPHPANNNIIHSTHPIHAHHTQHSHSNSQGQHSHAQLLHTQDTKVGILPDANSININSNINSNGQRQVQRRTDDAIDSILHGAMFSSHQPPPNPNTITNTAATTVPGSNINITINTNPNNAPNGLPEYRRPPVLPPPQHTHTYTLPPLSRPVKDLMTTNPEKMTPKERRRVRAALLSRKRKRSGIGIGVGGGVCAQNSSNHDYGNANGNANALLFNSSKRLALDTAALAAMDKKQLRTIRNRQVALEARQKAKARLQRLESENVSLKSKAASLEHENSLLKSQIEQLKNSAIDNAANINNNNNTAPRPWSGDVSLESVIAP